MNYYLLMLIVLVVLVFCVALYLVIVFQPTWENAGFESIKTKTVNSTPSVSKQFLLSILFCSQNAVYRVKWKPYIVQYIVCIVYGSQYLAIKAKK